MKKTVSLGLLFCMFFSLVSCASEASWVCCDYQSTLGDTAFDFARDKLLCAVYEPEYLRSEAPEQKTFSFASSSITAFYTSSCRKKTETVTRDRYTVKEEDASLTAEFNAETGKLVHLSFSENHPLSPAAEAITEEALNKFSQTLLSEWADVSAWQVEFSTEFQNVRFLTANGEEGLLGGQTLKGLQSQPNLDLAKSYTNFTSYYKVTFTKHHGELPTATQAEIRFFKDGEVQSINFAETELSFPEKPTNKFAPLAKIFREEILHAHQSNEQKLSDAVIDSILIGRDLDGSLYYKVTATLKLEKQEDTPSLFEETLTLWFCSEKAFSQKNEFAIKLEQELQGRTLIQQEETAQKNPDTSTENESLVVYPNPDHTSRQEDAQNEFTSSEPEGHRS